MQLILDITSQAAGIVGINQFHLQARDKEQRYHQPLADKPVAQIT